MTVRTLEAALGVHSEVLKQSPNLPQSECEGRLRLQGAYDDRNWSGGKEESRVVELWICECGTMVAIAGGAILNAYSRPRLPELPARDQVEELAAAFMLPEDDPCEGA